MDDLRIAFLHLAPLAGEITRNQRRVEHGIALAAEASANWIITPELVTSGYSFCDRIGTDWIAPQPDPWVRRICAAASRHGVAVFLAHVERDAARNTLHNTVIAIAATGDIAGRHRKINTLRVGCEAWSTPGSEATVVEIEPYGKVGLLICADAYTPAISATLKSQGARFLVSAANWAPGFHGPNGEWERISEQTGLPVFVCNRTGADDLMSFTAAESVVAHRGRRLFSMASEQATIFMLDWSLREERLRDRHPMRIDLPAIEK